MASVLIVEDSLVMRRNLKSILVQAGYSIIDEAVDGEDAVKKYEVHQPDFVTMDINMPKLNGIEATRQIVAAHPKARIIVISSIDQKQEVMDAIKAGAKFYILKPVTYEKVLDALKKLS